MPNHCSNGLIVLGEPNEVRDFVAKCRNPKYTGVVSEDRDASVEFRIYQNHYPCPEELYEVKADFTKKPDMIEKYGASDWYDWCNTYWGTKWGDYDTDLNNDGDGFAVFSFTTAWGPGADGLARISRDNPSLVFVNTYDEPGMGFFGTYVVSEGEIITDLEGEHSTPEGIDYDDPDQLDRMWETHAEEVAATENEAIELLAERWRDLAKVALKRVSV